MEKYNTLKNKKDYELFINSIPDYMEKLAKIIGKEELTFDEEETVQISSHFIDIYHEGLFTLDEKKEFIAYIGEAFRQRYGGEWCFTGLKSDSFAINEPVITKYKNEGIRFAPSEDIAPSLTNNDPNEFNSSVLYRDEMRKKNDKLFNEFFGKKKKRKKKGE